MIVLDTTVLVYALGSDHPFRQPCRRLIGAVTSGDVAATTTVEVVQEFVHVWARRRDRRAAAELGLDYAELLSPLLQVDVDGLRTGLALFSSGDRLGAFDAVLAAAALASGAERLVSADRAFGTVHGLAHVLPDANGVRQLLGDGERR